MQQEILTAAQYDQAVSRELDIQKKPQIASRQPAYFQQLKIELQEKLGDEFHQHAGLQSVYNIGSCLSIANGESGSEKKSHS